MAQELKCKSEQPMNLERTTLYQEFLAQREEILRHKWIESEKAGRDIGFDKALMDWVSKHRSGWLRSWLSDRHPPS
jgi:hypothetical protein